MALEIYICEISSHYFNLINHVPQFLSIYLLTYNYMYAETHIGIPLIMKSLLTGC